MRRVFNMGLGSILNRAGPQMVFSEAVSVAENAPRPRRPVLGEKLTVVLRVLWNGGVARAAIEEARRLGGLFVLREAAYDYDLSSVDLRVARRGEGTLTPLFWAITSIYAKQRGRDATVDLDLILTKWREVRGPALFHDQFAGIMGLLRREMRGEEYAVYIHEVALGSESIKYALPAILERMVLGGASAIFTNSRWNARVLEEYGFRAAVAYLGTYPQPRISLEREPIVLAVSMWDEGRRPRWYGELARRLRRGRLVMAGSWARADAMVRFAREYPEVEVTGRLSEGALRDLYSRASALVRFGFNERGPGLGVLEAMGYGVVPVVNDGLGSKEFLENGVDGFVVRDYEEAAQAISDLLDDEPRWRAMSLATWEKSKRFTWNAHADVIREEMRRRGLLRS